MEDAKRRAAIRVQAAKRKETDKGVIGMGSSKPSAKKKTIAQGRSGIQKAEGFDEARHWSNGGG